jgi:hypothetical protein
VAAFLGGSFVGAGSSLFYSGAKFAVKVNGVKISVALFETISSSNIEAYRRQVQTPITDDIIKQIKVKILQALVEEEVFYQQSEKYGIKVSDEEIKADLQSSQMFRNPQTNVFDIQRYLSFVRSINMTLREYEALKRKQIAGQKLKLLLTSSVKLWNYEIENNKRQTGSDSEINPLIQQKINLILNEWYSDVVKTSNIKTNASIMR